MRLGDLDVPAEDACVAQLEPRDARRLAQPPLELDDESLPAAHQTARFVEVRVEAVAHDPAIGGAGRGLVRDGAREQVVQVGAFVDPRCVRRHAERFAGGRLGAARERLGQGGQRAERPPQGDEVARRRPVEGELDRQPLHVAHVAQPVAYVAAHAPSADRTSSRCDCVTSSSARASPSA